MTTRLPPVLRDAGPDRLVYAAPPWYRPLAVTGALLAWWLGESIGRGTPVFGDALSPLPWFALAVILAMAALAEDRWTFVGAAGEADGTDGAGSRQDGAGGRSGPAGSGPGPGAYLTRRFGLLPLTRHWRLEAAEILRVELRAGRAGESIVERGGVEGVMETSLLGTGRGDWVALLLILGDRRALAVTTAAPRRAERLGADGRRIAARLGLPFIDSTGA